MALGPGLAGLKFWTPQGLTADNTADINDLPAGAVNWFNPWGPKRPVQDFICGTPPQFLAAPFTLVGDAGSYSLTGADAILALRHVAGAGSYTLTGSDAVLRAPDTANLPAGAANWFNPWGPKQPERSWTRPGIQLVPVVLVAASGSYTLTGTAAALAFGQVAGSGSYSVTGSSAALALGHVAGAGSYTLTGAAAGLTVAVNYAAAAGSYTITGSAATFAFGQGAGSGSYILTGANADFVIPGAVTYLPAGMSGSYVPWRRPYPTALLTRTGRPLAVAPTTLTAAGGSYTITGTAALFTVVTPADTTNLPAGATSWFNPWRRQYPTALRTWTAQPIIVGPVVLTAGAGSYTLTGSDVSFIGVTPPVEVTPPPTGGAGAGVRVGRYKQFKLKKKRKHDQCEELLEYLRSLPPAEAEAAVAELPPRYLSLLDGLPLPHALVLPPAAARTDDDDDDACALLLELLLR